MVQNKDDTMVDDKMSDYVDNDLIKTSEGEMDPNKDDMTVDGDKMDDYVDYYLYDENGNEFSFEVQDVEENLREKRSVTVKRTSKKFLKMFVAKEEERKSFNYLSFYNSLPLLDKRPDKKGLKELMNEIKKLILTQTSFSTSNEYKRTTISEVMNNVHKEFWLSAMDEEYLNWLLYDAFQLVPAKGREKLIKSHWIFSLKSNEDNIVIKFKARLICV